MKLEKRTDKDKKTDIYILSIPRKEADAAFAAMNDFEKRFIIELQQTARVSDCMKILELWTHKIEEVKAGNDTPDRIKYDG
jgi:hypothetical protein